MVKANLLFKHSVLKGVLLMIVWNDDCLSCLCGFPHSMEKHMQAIKRADLEREQQQQEDMGCDLFEDMGSVDDTHKGVEPLDSGSYVLLVKVLGQSLHGV